MPMVSSMAPFHFLWQDNQTEMQYDLLVMWCHWYWDHITPMALSMAYGMGASTGTSPRTKGHIIPLNHHLNITNSMLSLMAPSASCYCHVHNKNWYTPLMSHIIHTCQLAHVYIWHLYVSIYAWYDPTAIKGVNRNSCIHTFFIIGVCPRISMHATLYICVPLQCFCSLQIQPHCYMYK